MRPVLLEMAGFASFREPTTVDFRDAEYFALVGPTGSGKSTVIDALTFALYGSVPRWDDRRTVALALAPTVGRGTVRLVFDVGGARFVVARELRRATSGAVSVRSARLERLRSAEGTGSVDEETDPLADGAGAVTKAVEELLGLPFGDFCTCVVLPQGEFAEFLHTEPRKRQEKLVRILGLGVYDQIARDANTEAAAARQRVDVLAEQLIAYADATPEAEQVAAARVTELVALRTRVTAAAPRLASLSATMDEVAAQLADLRAEQALLGALSVPDGLRDLDARQRCTTATQDAARLRAEAAENTDATARDRLAAAPARGPLEQARRHHAELGALTAELPGARDRHAKAVAAEGAAARDAADVAGALDAVRTEGAAAAAALTATRDAEHRIIGERDRLRTVTTPAGLAVLDRRRSSAVSTLEDTAAALSAAETRDASARDTLAAAPARSPLEQARRDHRDLAVALGARPVAVEVSESAQWDLDAAAAAVVRHRHRLDHARERRSEMQRANLAATLRPSLVPGDPCPVCAQAVTTLPAPLPGADVAGGERLVARAEAEHEQARRQESAAEAAHARAASEIERLDGVITALRSALAEVEVPGVPVPGEPAAVAPVGDRDAGGTSADGAGRHPDRRLGDGGSAGAPTAAAVDAALDALDLLTVRAGEADAAVRAARRHREAAAAAVEAIGGEAAAAAAALRAARDPLVPLGAPAIDEQAHSGDVLAGWSALVGWARVQATARDTALHQARAATAVAEQERDRVAAALQSAESAAHARRRDETAAARAEQETRGAVAGIERRSSELRSALAEAPADTVAAAELERLTALEHAARVADGELRAARAAVRSAEQAAGEIGREVTSAWDGLRAARDPLVGLAAPTVAGQDLLAAGTALTEWAVRETHLRDARITAAQGVLTQARLARDDIERGLAEDLAAHTVDVAQVDVAQVDVQVGVVQAADENADGRTAPGRTASPDTTALPRGTPGALLGVSAAAALPAVAATLERARGARERVVERRAAASAMAADRDESESVHQVAKLLGALLRSDGFPRWLVASALDALVADASRSLAELSGGQFELTHAGGEFLVVDHADADARRPVKTLSGGETFQASLALALALSAQMSGLAARGAARLESIFLDEGFGTLDEANLEVVAGTLEHLATRGDRMVGVVTHVPALAQRVPVRFAVSRDQRTSSVVRESA